jgi:hypothetical protein
MQLKLTKRTVDGILAVECNGRIVFGEESALTKRVGDLLQVTKLLTVFDVHDSEYKALESFRTAA